MNNCELKSRKKTGGFAKFGRLYLFRRRAKSLKILTSEEIKVMSTKTDHNVVLLYEIF